MPWRSRHLAPALLALALLPSTALAWDSGGTPVCALPGAQVSYRTAIPDGLGGTLVAWSDDRNGSGGPSGEYLLRLLPNGERAPGWPENGHLITPSHGGTSTPRLCSDGAGGAYYVWDPVRNRSPYADVLAMHVLADGTNAPGWPAGGLVVCDTTDEHRDPVCVPDGSGGVIVVWRDARNYVSTYSDLCAQRLTFGGAIAPGWPTQGAAVTRSTLYEYGPVVAGDGSGGVWVAWHELVENDGGIQHLGADSRPVGNFPVNGLRLRPGSGYKSPELVVAAPDGSALAIWGDGRPAGGNPPGGPGLYACRFDGDTTRAPGWPVTGRALPAFDWGQAFAFEASPGAPDGGVVMAWSDSSRTIRIGRIDAEAALPAGWTTAGVTVSAPVAPALTPGALMVASDGANGVFVSWSWYALGAIPSPGSWDVYTSHVLSSSSIEPGWPATGLAVESTPAFETPIGIVPDASGGAVVVFTRGLQDSCDLYASRVFGGGVVPVQVSLVDAHWTGRAIALAWQLGEPPARVDVERDAGEGWARVATLAPDGTGRVAWSDGDVAPGGHYAYRLRWSEGVLVRTGGETALDVPAATLALRALGGLGGARLAFRLTLAPGVPARLALYDVQGRRVASVDLAAGEPQREIAMGAGALAPGLYLARLEQRAAQVRTRVIVTR